ncbi:MAG: cytidylyltransferase domain-containing protein [Promethearchaeota archaeon]
MDILALIPARGGSKKLPRKNIALLSNKPLIYYSIKIAQESKLINRIIVSTDDKEIAEISKNYGAEVPFIRPSIFSQDLTPDLPVFTHALMWLLEKEEYCPEIVVHLRPTSPLRETSIVDKAIKLLLDNSDAHSVRAVVTPDENPYKMWKIGNEGYLEPIIKTKIKEAYNQPRQVLVPVYWQTGYIDVVRSCIILNMGSMTGDRILPLILDNIPENKIDIDTQERLNEAEKLMKKRSKSE